VPAVHFDAFSFDRGRRELRRDGALIELSPKAFELLGLLLERQPDAVSKAMIRDRVWPDTIVSDSSLPRLVNVLRRALGDDAETPRYLRTVHGFGYAFCGPARDDRGPRGRGGPLALLVWGSKRFELGEGSHEIGRDPAADVWLDATTVSRRHARLAIADGAAHIEDLKSKNGTWVGNERVARARTLQDGDEIRLGEARVTFCSLSRLASTHSTPGSRPR
jgi:DNA-binding winged helix-turn-helix (wHTH) protein